MPNWTDNIITIKHADKAKIDLIDETQHSEIGVLQAIIPCPAELNDEDLTTYSHGPEQAVRDQKKAALKAKYGFDSWYEWNIAKWGTKWDLCQPIITRVDDNTVTITCQTAWSPPTNAFETMTEMGYEVHCFYCGEGPEYAGIWDHGNDLYFNTTDGSKDAAAKLPKELDDAFGIVSTLEEYERENEEELTLWIKDGVEATKATTT